MPVLGFVFLMTTLAGIISVEALPDAESGSAAWHIVVGTNSAALSHRGALIISSSVVSWPDGRQDLITFWETDETLYRCVDHIRSSATFADGPCFSPR